MHTQMGMTDGNEMGKMPLFREHAHTPERLRKAEEAKSDPT